MRATWTNLLEHSHNDALDRNVPSPWEAVAQDVIRIGRRLKGDENVFPVNIVLQLLLQYHVQYFTSESSPRGTADRDLIRCTNFSWPIDVFIDLGVGFEHLIATLEAVWYAQEWPFQGHARRSIVKWIIYTVEEWYRISNQEGLLFGGEENAIGIAECLRVVLSNEVLSRREAEDREWLERGRVISQKVDAATRSGGRQSRVM